MLESLGLGEAASQDEADVVVFNTCTIREKPDQRLAAHLAQAKALKDRDPERVIAVGGCYAEAQRERIFELYPFVDVAFGPGSIPHLGDWLGAGGEAPRGRFAEWVHFAGDLPVRRERPFQAWVQVSMGCNSKCAYCIVPCRARPRAIAPARRHRRRGCRRWPPTASARSRCSGRTSTRTDAICCRRSRPGFAELLRALRRGRRNRADPLHEPASEGLPARRDRGDGRVRQRSASTRTCRSSPARPRC